MSKIYDVVIIGAGPAGMSAAIYAKRAGLSVGMIEYSAPGGKMVKTAEILNYPSFTQINGVDLSLKMFEQVQNLEVDYLYGEVIDLKDGNIKEIICKDGTVYQGKVVIVATGTNPNPLNIPGEDTFISKGVSYCAICDGSFFKNKVVAVIGGGNSALEESLYLTQFVDKLYIIIRRDVFRAEAIIQEKVLKHPKIEIIRNHIPIEIKGDDKVDTLCIQDVQTKEITELKVDGIFPYIGATPSTAFLKHLDVLDDRGYIVVNDKMETTVPGIYGAGDCNVKHLRQIVTAVNDGAIAGQNSYHYLND